MILGTASRVVAQHKLLAGVAFALLFMAFSPGFSGATPQDQKLVSIFADGREYTFATDAKMVDEAIKRAGLVLHEDDDVEPGLMTPINTDGFNVNVYRARPYMVIDGGRKIHVMSSHRSPAHVAQDAGLTVYDEDEYTMERIDDFVNEATLGLKLIIKRATPVTVEADNQILELRTHKTTVGELFDEKGIVLNGEDFSDTPLEAPLTPGMRVRVFRVGYGVTAQEEVIPRPVRVIYDSNRDVSFEEVQEEGSDGKKMVTYKIRMEDGYEAGREAIQTVVITQPKEKVVIRGSQFGDDVWARLRLCEAGGSYARNSGNGYYGAYQFSPGTWAAWAPEPYKGVLPHLAPPSVQDEAARSLQAVRGWAPWPGCRAKLGLP